MVAFVATALAADRAVAAAPKEGPQMTQVVRRMAGRLVVSFRRSVAAAPYRTYRHETIGESNENKCLAALPPDPVLSTAFEFSPSLYRLPPPQV